MTDEIPLVRPASYDRKVGLVLQGGGTLGSYQAGVYTALVASEIFRLGRRNFSRSD